ncbi:unnamed protein product [Sympodiomycopsis kandeliae]
MAQERLQSTQSQRLLLAMCHYIRHRLRQSRADAGAGRPLVRTVPEWVQHLVWCLIMEFKSQRDDLRTLLSGPSTQDSNPYKLHNFVRELATTYDLPRKSERARLYYGKHEAALMIRGIETELLNSSMFKVLAKLQTMNMIKLLLFTGIRPSSVGRSQLEVESHCALPIENVHIIHTFKVRLHDWN